MGIFEHFPYTNFHELNATWMIEELVKLKTTIEQFVSINALKYADPIQWNIVSQYEKNTIVIDPQTGTAYISVQAVPSGVALTNTDYWTVVFDLGGFVVRAAKNFTSNYEEATTLTATFPTTAGDWLVWGDTLYVALVNITAGDAYVVDSNIKHITIEDIIGHLEDLSTTDKSNLVAAINEVFQALQNTAGDLNNLSTTDKSNLVAAINEVLQTLLNTAGNLNDLNTSDKSNLVASINEVLQRIDIANADALLKAAPFIANREGSTAKGYQAFIRTYDSYLLAYETSTGFSIDQINLSNFDIINTYNYNISAHPNAMFADRYLTYIYIVDSINHVIIKLDNNLSVVGIISDFQSLNIISGNTDEHYNMYLFGDNKIYKFDGTNITDTITLENVNMPASAVGQGIFVYNDIIYKVYNRPNSLVFYNPDGDLLGFKELPLGDGFYPFGEVEFFSIYNSAVIMLSACYSTRKDTNDVIMFSQLFDTNISSPIASNTKYGQSYPESSTLRLNSTVSKSKNPDGTVSDPFKNGYELSCVYDYLYTQYAYKGFINLAGNSDMLLLYNCKATIDNSSNKSLSLLQILNSTVNISNVTADNLMSSGSDLKLNNCTITSAFSYHSNVRGYKTSITSCTSQYSNITGNINITNFTNTSSDIIEFNGMINDNITTTEKTYSTGSYLKSILSDSMPTTISITAFHIGSPFTNAAIRIGLGTGDKTDLAGGTDVTRNVVIPLYIGTKFALVRLEITVDSNYDIKGRIVDSTNIDGSAASLSGIFLTTINVVNSITHI